MTYLNILMNSQKAEDEARSSSSGIVTLHIFYSIFAIRVFIIEFIFDIIGYRTSNMMVLT